MGALLSREEVPPSVTVCLYSFLRQLRGDILVVLPPPLGFFRVFPVSRYGFNGVAWPRYSTDAADCIGIWREGVCF